MFTLTIRIDKCQTQELGIRLMQTIQVWARYFGWRVEYEIDQTQPETEVIAHDPQTLPDAGAGPEVRQAHSVSQ